MGMVWGKGKGGRGRGRGRIVLMLFFLLHPFGKPVLATLPLLVCCLCIVFTFSFWEVLGS